MLLEIKDCDVKKYDLAPWLITPNEKAIGKTPFTCEEIALVTGKLGAGKSMFLMERFVWPELTKGKRTIVTNLRLNLGNLRDAIQTYTSRDGSEVFDRIRIVSDDEAQQFWLHRGRWRDGSWWDAKDVKVTEKGRGENEISDYLPNHPHFRDDDGILYIIDEAHKGFRARDWMSFGRTGEWYFNLVRHCSDTVVFACPHPSQIDKYIRNLIQKVYVMRNGKKEKFLKIFKGPGRFFWTQYEGPYEDKGMEEKSSGHYNMRLWLAECYHTSMFGGNADKGKTVSGVPFKMFPIGLVLAAVLLLSLPKILQVGFSSWLRSLWPGQTVVAKSTNNVPIVTNRTVDIQAAINAAVQKAMDGRPVKSNAALLPKVDKVKRLVYHGECGSGTDMTFVADEGMVLHGHAVKKGVIQSDDGDVYFYKALPYVKPVPAQLPGSGLAEEKKNLVPDEGLDGVTNVARLTVHSSGNGGSLKTLGSMRR